MTHMIPAKSHLSTGFLPLVHDLDVVACRRTVREIAAELKFSVTGETMLVTAASELARNTLIHGGGGRFSWEILRIGTRRGVRLSFEDEGPGIADIPRAMTNGWTSGKGLGLGLPGAKRLVNQFALISAPGRGTRVVITRWQS
jgi:serine/threonine-protein kinase RsbT